jgi:hypothetical protein
MNRFVRSAGLATALLGSASCGALVTVIGSTPANHRSRAAFRCVESKAVPVADVLGAGIASIYMFGGQGEAVAIGTVTAAIYAVSAKLGINATRRCREAKLELAIRSAFAADGRLAISDTVGPPEPVVLEIDFETHAVAVGDSLRLHGAVRAASGAPIGGATVSWQSRDRRIARVGAGVLTGVAQGTTLIIARHAHLADTAVIVVGPR